MTSGQITSINVEKGKGTGLIYELEELEKVCDVEGSGIDDCADEYAACCDQSICDHIQNPEGNPDKRCCTKEQMQQDQIPSDCTPCILCCDEEERNMIPLPKYCSKCPKCSHITLTARTNKSGK